MMMLGMFHGILKSYLLIYKYHRITAIDVVPDITTKDTVCSLDTMTES